MVFNEKSISNTSQRGFNPNIDIVYFLSHLLQVAGDSKYIHILLNDITYGTYSFLEEQLQVHRLWINIEELSNGFLKKILIQI